jgi:anti-sigma factor RsiW
MTCTEFNETIQRYLDGTLAQDEEPRMFAHAEGCLMCAGVRDALICLDRDLRQLPERDMPQPLLHALERIPRTRAAAPRSVTWKPELVRATAYAVAGVAASLLFGHFQREPHLIGQMVLAFAGIFVFTMSVLRPLFLPPPRSWRVRGSR